MSVFTDRPAATEFAPFYAGYVGLVPAGDVREHMRTQVMETIALLSGVTEAKAEQAYAPGKWTLKEVLGHVCDTERVFSYRMLSIARGDPASLPPFDENLWVPASNANSRTMPSLLLELATIRAATVQLVNAFDATAWTRLGTASGKSVSVRALAHITAGHERHHIKIIRERYLAS
jgi:hypothetical protein